MNVGISPPLMAVGGSSRVIEELEPGRNIAGMKELPIACTLDAAGLADRGEWLRRLGAESLLDGRRTDDGLELRFDAAAQDEVRRWVKAESECCAFLSFDLGPAEGDLRLSVTGPAGAEPILDGLLAALRKSPGRPGHTLRTQ
jgi:hypothetical protein